MRVFFSLVLRCDLHRKHCPGLWVADDESIDRIRCDGLMVSMGLSSHSSTLYLSAVVVC